MTVMPNFPNIDYPQRGALKIAVIGSGISGSSAAMMLSRQHDVTVFEKNAVAGGHTATVDIDYDGKAISVDTGFIVYNEATYPKLTKLFAELDVKTHESNMSFSMSLDNGGLEWCGDTISTIFAQKRNIMRPSFLRMLAEIMRFNRICLLDRTNGHLKACSIGDYLNWRRFSRDFADNYLMPMAAAIWSTPTDRMLEFPAERFVNFFDNHRLINIRQHAWRTVSGGSRNYLDKLLSPLGANVKLNCGVSHIRRHAGHVDITDEQGRQYRFDHVIMACHSDQSLKILSDATPQEQKLLSAVGWQANRIVLHRDPSLMPVRKKVWAAWNYLKSSSESGDKDVAVTYWMNRLQGIDAGRPLFVTLNPDREPDPRLVFGEYSYDHPQFDADSFHAQDELKSIQGRNNTFFAGAWTGYGFHEDGLSSGLAAADAILDMRGRTAKSADYLEAAE